MNKKLFFGLIFGVIFCLISIFLSFALFSKTPNADLGFAIPMAFIGFPLYWIFGYIFNALTPELANSVLFSAAVGIVSVTIQWFVIGYLIGSFFQRKKINVQ